MRAAAGCRPWPARWGATTLDRRSFLKRSGLTVGGLAAAGALPFATVRQARAVPGPQPGAPIEIKKNICTHCSVGCTVTAEVQNGVWTGQEPSWNSPINRGTHCAKGASIREIVHGERRLKYPLKMVGGQWQRLSWEQAIDEIGDKMTAIREQSGADSVYWLGSAKFTNEAAYLMRKFGAFWGTNSVDHQARICHSTTVAGGGQHLGATGRRPTPTTTSATPGRWCSSAPTRRRRTRWRCSTCWPARR